MSASLWKKPGALVPLAMSLAAIAMVLVHFAVFVFKGLQCCAETSRRGGFR